MVNIHPGTIAELYKMASVNLCPNTIGQVSVALMCNPPKEGDPSYELYKQERGDTLASLRRRAHIMTEAFNSCEGVSCNVTEGAMYSFPQVGGGGWVGGMGVGWGVDGGWSVAESW